MAMDLTAIAKSRFLVHKQHFLNFACSSVIHYIWKKIGGAQFLEKNSGGPI